MARPVFPIKMGFVVVYEKHPNLLDRQRAVAPPLVRGVYGPFSSYNAAYKWVVTNSAFPWDFVPYYGLEYREE